MHIPCHFESLVWKFESMSSQIKLLRYAPRHVWGCNCFFAQGAIMRCGTNLTFFSCQKFHANPFRVVSTFWNTRVPCSHCKAWYASGSFFFSSFYQLPVKVLWDALFAPGMMIGSTTKATIVLSVIHFSCCFVSHYQNVQNKLFK